jgi:hypothetical protein
MELHPKMNTAMACQQRTLYNSAFDSFRYYFGRISGDAKNQGVHSFFVQKPIFAVSVWKEIGGYCRQKCMHFAIVVG